MPPLTLHCVGLEDAAIEPRAGATLALAVVLLAIDLIHIVQVCPLVRLCNAPSKGNLNKSNFL